MLRIACSQTYSVTKNMFWSYIRRFEKAISETIRICTDEEVLKEYLSNRKEEVVDMMCALFDEEKIMKAHDKTVHEEGMAKGRAECKAELIAQMKATGMTDEQINKVLSAKV